MTYTEPKVKRDLFNLSLRPRLNHSSLLIRHLFYNEDDFIEYDNQTGFGLGLEFEIILPIKKDKWSFITEPTFQNFQSEKTINDVSVVFGGQVATQVDYSSIELPVGIRYYFLLNDQSKLFVDASVIFDSSINSTFEYQQLLGSGKLNVNSSTNYTYGIGYKYKNKFSLQVRTQTTRDILANDFQLNPNNYWRSDYKSLSFIFGYTMF